MIVLDDKKICFVCPPKNGTHTIYNHLKNHGGRRIGEYHDYRWWKIPRKNLGFTRYQTIIVWREPIDRALSLFKDIVLREQQSKRKVVSQESITIHEEIARKCTNFRSFVDYICNENSEISNYLFKPQSWWYQKVQPDQIINLTDLNAYLEELTGLPPTIEHTSSDIDTTALQITPLDQELIDSAWAKNDFTIKPN